MASGTSTPKNTRDPKARTTVFSALRARIELRMLIPALLAALLFPVAQWLLPPPSSVGDAYGYLMTAQRVVEDGYYAYGHDPPGSDLPPNARVTPVWPLALAAVLSVHQEGSSEPEEWARDARLSIKALMLVFTVGIVLAATLSGRVLAGGGAGLVAGCMALIYIPFHRAGSVTLAEHMGAFTLAWALYAGLRLTAREHRRTPLAVAVLGALCAVMVLARPNLALWAFVPLAYAIVMRLESPLRLVRLALVGALGFCLVMAPWWARNATVTGRFIPVKSDYVPAQPETVDDAGETDPAPTPAPVEEPDGPQFEIPSGWEHTDPTMVLRRASVPWMPFFDVAWEDEYRPEAARIEYPERSVAPVPVANAVIGAMTFYHRVVLILALFSLFFIRKVPRLTIALAVPIAMLAIHWSHVTIRYFYPPMVALVLMAGVGAWALYQTIVRRNDDLFEGSA